MKKPKRKAKPRSKAHEVTLGQKLLTLQAESKQYYALIQHLKDEMRKQNKWVAEAKAQILHQKKVIDEQADELKKLNETVDDQQGIIGKQQIEYMNEIERARRQVKEAQDNYAARATELITIKRRWAKRTVRMQTKLMRLAEVIEDGIKPEDQKVADYFRTLANQ